MRKEIQKECAFLAEWGRLFKQCHTDAPELGFLQKYQICLDAHEALQGKPLHFNTDEEILRGLKNIITYLSNRNQKGLFKSPAAYISVVKQFESIIELL